MSVVAPYKFKPKLHVDKQLRNEFSEMTQLSLISQIKYKEIRVEPQAELTLISLSLGSNFLFQMFVVMCLNLRIVRTKCFSLWA